MHMNRISALCGVTVLAALVPVLAFGKGTVPYLPVPKGAAVIYNTGSTNSLGYRIVVTSSGSAEYVAGGARIKGHVNPAIAKKFFADLAKGLPLFELPIEKCMKSASFGTSTFVWWRGQRSGDVECAGDQHGNDLARDAFAIATALKIEVHALRPLPANEPRRPLLEASPTPNRG
jgi:hypothetical protein